VLTSVSRHASGCGLVFDEGIHRIEEVFLLQCTRPPRPDTYIILKIQYFHRWKTVTINGEFIPISIAAAEARTAISISPVKFGNRGDGLNLPWFNHADAALFSSEMHPNDQCSLHVRLVPRKDVADTFDIVPCTPFGFANLAARLLTVVLSPDSNAMPTFEFPNVESLSPSTMYMYVWRSGVLLPIIRHLFKLPLIFGAVFVLIVCAAIFRAFLLRRVPRHIVNDERIQSHPENRFGL
jgi:hypothetical protein